MNPFKRRNKAVEAFEKQFQPDGDGYIYRKYGTGSAYRITSAERDEFIADFRRAMRWSMIGLIAATLLFAAALSAFDLYESSLVFFGFGIVTCLPLFLAIKRMYAAPEFRLQHRRMAMQAMSIDEQKRDALAQISYWQLAFAPLLGLLVLGWIAEAVDVTSGWGRTAWLVPISFALLAAVQGWRKFRASRQS